MLNLLLLLFQWETNKYVKHYINKTSIIFLFFSCSFSLSFHHVLFVKASKTNRRKIISFFLFCSTRIERGKKPLGREKKPYIHQFTVPGSCSFFYSSIFGRMRMSTKQGSHAHTSVQPTLIVLANSEKNWQKQLSWWFNEAQVCRRILEKRQKIFTCQKIIDDCAFIYSYSPGK
jgi:hypothetical protein